MPPWQYLLTDDERWALVDYIKAFSPRFRNAPVAGAVALPEPQGSRDARRGRDVYEQMQCAKCHGSDGRGVGPSSATLLDTAGRFVNSRDFTQAGTYRTGWTEREIVRTPAPSRR